jgi:hypothetical protein
VLPRATWDRAAELARDLDSVPALVAGLQLVSAGRALVGRLALPTATTVEARLRASSPPHTAGGFDWLAHVPGLRPKLAYLLRKLFPPATWLRTWSPLARRGLLGLTAAYMWRPVWLVGHAGPGFLAWRRARRDARRAG